MCSAAAAAAAAAAPLRLLSPPLNQSHLSKVEPLPPPPPKLRGHQRAPAAAVVPANLTLEQLATQTLTVAQNCPVGSFFPLFPFFLHFLGRLSDSLASPTLPVRQSATDLLCYFSIGDAHWQAELAGTFPTSLHSFSGLSLLSGPHDAVAAVSKEEEGKEKLNRFARICLFYCAPPSSARRLPLMPSHQQQQQPFNR